MHPELRVVVADDEALARQRVVRLLEALGGVRIVAVCSDGQAALDAVAGGGVDALFLDVQMPGLLGTDVAGLLGAGGPAVVFLTAHAEHAVQAFAQGAVDYVLKPVDPERLALAVRRVRERLPAPTPLDGRIALPTAEGAVLLDRDRISHAVIDGESVAIHAERRHFTDLRLADLERRLGPGFLRVHRQALVNLAWIERLELVDSGGYLAHLRGGAVVAVSRAAGRQLRRDWGLPR